MYVYRVCWVSTAHVKAIGQLLPQELPINNALYTLWSPNKTQLYLLLCRAELSETALFVL